MNNHSFCTIPFKFNTSMLQYSNIILGILLIIFSHICPAQYLAMPLLSPQRIDTLNPYTCEISTGKDLTLADGSANTTISRFQKTALGYIFSSVSSNIYRLDAENCHLDSIYNLQTNNLSGIEANHIDTIITVRVDIPNNTSVFYRANKENNVIYTDTLNYLIFDLEFFEDKLYGVNRTYLFELSPSDGSILDTLLISQYNDAFHAFAFNPTSCGESSIILIGQDEENFGNPNARYQFYEYFPNRDELVTLCAFDEWYRSVATFNVDYNCTIVIDTDHDNSGGLFPYHFRQSPMCQPDTSAITDIDPYVYSSLGFIDSIIVNIHSGNLDGDDEQLYLIEGEGYDILRQSFDQLVISAGTFDDYKNALRQLRYIHSGSSMQSGDRIVSFLAFSNDLVSDTAFCYIPIASGAFAGPDVSMEHCADNGALELSDIISDLAHIGGVWSPSTSIPVGSTGHFSFQYIVEGDSVCPSDTADYSIFVGSLEDLSVVSDTAICDGAEVVIGVENLDGDYSFLWEDGSTSPQKTVYSPGGTFRLIVEIAECTDTIDINVSYAHFSSLQLVDSLVLCSHSLNIGPFPYTDVDYNWSTGETQPEITVNSSGMYSLTISDDDCSVSDSMYVQLFQMPTFDNYLDTTACADPITLGLPLFIEEKDLEWLWWDGSQDREKIIEQDGEYRIDLRYGPCESFFTYLVSFIDIIPPRLEDTIVCDTMDLRYSIQGDWDSIEWSTGAQTPTIKIVESGVYSVKAMKDGCVYTSSAIVEVITCETCPIYIPNAITPNGDGINERFEVFSPCDIAELQITIYNRWGNIVYKGQNSPAEWPSNRTKEGVYIYAFEYTDPENNKKTVLSGDVTVIK